MKTYITKKVPSVEARLQQNGTLISFYDNLVKLSLHQDLFNEDFMTFCLYINYIHTIV